MVARGEVWWYEHPAHGRRPHLILTRSEAIPVLNQVIAVPATRTVRGIPTEVSLGEADGMPQPCVLALDTTRVVRRALLTRRITVLSAARMHQVCEALAHATGCAPARSG